MPRFQDLTGMRFGRWTVLSRGPDYRAGIPQWNCHCDCGNEAVVRAQTLKIGHSKSCGCYGRDVWAAQCKDRALHGLTGTPEWNTWDDMNNRCYQPNGGAYAKYGAKGVTVCDRWRHDFRAFLADMGHKPKGTTIDRIDNSRGYEPGNCRWATWTEQQNNRMSNVRLTLDGKSLTLMQWSRALGIHRHTIRNRLNAGWPIKKVLSPTKHGRGGKPLDSAG